MAKSSRSSAVRPFPPMGLGECLIGAAELRNVTQVIRSQTLFRYYGVGNAPHPNSFASRVERAGEAMHGVPYALGVSSGTAALEVALGALGVGPGDEVILPVWSWVSCFTAIVRVGGQPVLAEVDETLNLDPKEIERLTTPRTRGVLVVHYQGVPADLDPILRAAKKRGLWVLEDNAESLGTTYKGRRVGSLGDIAICSFQQRKVVTTGEGGMVLTRSPKLYERAVRMSDLGLYRQEHQARAPLKEPMFPGSNFRMGELTAAVALAQLARVDPMVKKVRALREVLLREMGDLPGVTWRRIPDPSGDIGFESYLFMPKAEQARAVRARAGERGITLTPHTGTYAQTAREYVKNRSTHAGARGPFQHFQDWPAPGYRPEDFPRTHDLAERLIAIPIGVLFRKSEVARIGRVLREEIRRELG
ncbi:MAG: DegT/DnrJ/EryC1/StrS family aminotransferase [Opitutaceae bacterium]|nr:DegT/DnrJ/EryC1/StrS family aminotransferase [Opitutaceae bacterium]